MKTYLLNVSTVFLCTSVLLGAALSAQASCGSGASATITNLPTDGNQGYQVNALNSVGQFTGYFFNNSVQSEAFIYNNGSVIDLGNLGGTFSQGRAINSSGLVVGLSQTTSAQFHAASFDGTSVLDLGTLGGSSSSATAVNDAGLVVGSSLTTGDAATEAFVYSSGSMIGLGTLGGAQSVAFALNNQGLVVGEATDTNGNFHAFSYTSGPLQDLGTLGGNYSAAFAVNDAGLIVGESSITNGDIHPFVYSSGTMTDLGTFGGTYSSAFLVNQSNQVAGTATMPDGSSHGFFFSGTLTDLGTLGGSNLSPNAMNNLGQIVGQADTATGSSHAFLWQQGTLLDLNSFLPTNSGWELTNALCINDAGRIIAAGVSNDVEQTFVIDLATSSDNASPTAVAGTNQTVCCGTQVTLDGSQSFDPDGDPLTYEWSQAGYILGTNATLTGVFAGGTNYVTLKVTDPCGASAFATVTVTVKQTSRPTIKAPGLLIVLADESHQAVVPDLSSLVVVSDNCAPVTSLTLTQSPPAGTIVGLGRHVITVTVADPAGKSATSSTTLKVRLDPNDQGEGCHHH